MVGTASLNTYPDSYEILSMSVRQYVGTSRSCVSTFPRSELVTWPRHVTYPLSYGLTSVNTCYAASRSSSVSNRNIFTSLFIRSATPTPSSLFLSLKISSISKSLIQGIVFSDLI